MADIRATLANHDMHMLMREDNSNGKLLFQPRLILGVIAADGITPEEIEIFLMERSLDDRIHITVATPDLTRLGYSPDLFTSWDAAEGLQKEEFDALYQRAKRNSKAVDAHDLTAFRQAIPDRKWKMGETATITTLPWLRRLWMAARGHRVAHDLTAILVFSRETASRIFPNAGQLEDGSKTHVGVLALNTPYEKRASETMRPLHSEAMRLLAKLITRCHSPDTMASPTKSKHEPSSTKLCATPDTTGGKPSDFQQPRSKSANHTIAGSAVAGSSALKPGDDGPAAPTAETPPVKAPVQNPLTASFPVVDARLPTLPNTAAESSPKGYGTKQPPGEDSLLDDNRARYTHPLAQSMLSPVKASLARDAGDANPHSNAPRGANPDGGRLPAAATKKRPFSTVAQNGERRANDDGHDEDDGDDEDNGGGEHRRLRKNPRTPERRVHEAQPNMRLPTLPFGETDDMRYRAIHFAEYMDSDLGVARTGRARTMAIYYANYMLSLSKMGGR